MLHYPGHAGERPFHGGGSLIHLFCLATMIGMSAGRMSSRRMQRDQPVKCQFISKPDELNSYKNKQDVQIIPCLDHHVVIENLTLVIVNMPETCIGLCFLVDRILCIFLFVVRRRLMSHSMRHREIEMQERDLQPP